MNPSTNNAIARNTFIYLTLPPQSSKGQTEAGQLASLRMLLPLSTADDPNDPKKSPGLLIIHYILPAALSILTTSSSGDMPATRI